MSPPYIKYPAKFKGVCNLNVAEEEDIVEGVKLLEKGKEENNRETLNFITFNLTFVLPLIPPLWTGTS